MRKRDITQLEEEKSQLVEKIAQLKKKTKELVRVCEQGSMQIKN